jgi:hypothetical protein
MNGTSEATANSNGATMHALVVALADAEQEFPPLVPDATNPHFGSQYVTLGAIIAATRPPLARHGLVITQTMEPHEGVVHLVTTLRHIDGAVLESRVPLPAWKGPQDAGSLLTYLRRYSVAGLLNLASESDDDANDAEHGQRAQRASDARRGARNDAAIARRNNATPRAAQRETAPKQVRDDVVKNPDELAETLADLIDIAGTTGQLDSLVPQLATLPASHRPPLRVRFSERRSALAEIERDRADLDALENPED